MPPTRRLADEPPEQGERPPPPAPQEPALLALQRSAGNAAVAQLIAREPAFSPIRPDAPYAGPDLRLPAGALDDWTAAGEAADAYFDSIVSEHRETLKIPGSMAQLVHAA